MAAPAAAQAGPDTIVTVKVTFDGATRRAKMHLRDMVPKALEEQVRGFLHIPAGVDIMIERYSDSAATFILIESGNMPVYKQLYRAAKAKSKLKLRVSIKGQQDKTVPKPASVEDETETEGTSSKLATNPEQMTIEPPKAVAPVQVTLPVRNMNRSALYDPTRPVDAAAKPTETPAQRLAKLAEKQRRIRENVQRGKELYDARMREARQNQSQPQVNFSSVPGSFPNFANDEFLAALPQAIRTKLPAPSFGANFAVCCNSCEKNIADAHYHCSTCDDGDYDLCPSCVDMGITCYSNDHWLIKRSIVNGQVQNSTTERIAPKPKQKTETNSEVSAAPSVATPNKPQMPALRQSVPIRNIRPVVSVPPKAPQNPVRVFGRFANMRTCNCCVEELPSRDFLHCTTCDDYDLCKACFAKGGHGHHPMHGFVPAVAGTAMPDHVNVKLAPGRNQMHHAICDGCDKYINGVRHKCLDCPDWDYCSDCFVNASFIHAKHRFVPIYEPLKESSTPFMVQPVHHGICCDGPLCSESKGNPAYIRGTRYKCAVCHDLDFCANCEASPSNEHNKTHPLIKFKTPVRHVSVTTTGEHHDGRRMPLMGDRSGTDSKATETVSPVEGNAINAVQTVVDVKPAEPAAAVDPEPKIKEEPDVKEEAEVKEEPSVEEQPAVEETAEDKPEDLCAVFVRDTVVDGTILPTNHVFEQTWILRNEGEVAWPAGCSVKFVGGDYMGHVDSAHPAGISELVSASESTVCYAPLAPGQEFAFTVLLRTPARHGKISSYWRLTTPEGFKFGHRLWCEVNVRSVSPPTPPQIVIPEEEVQEADEKGEADESAESTMIFPKLEKESPMSSIHQDLEPAPIDSEEKTDKAEDFEECVEDDEWDASDDGFLTDEEYDILDASDEEFLEEQEKKLLQK